MHGVDPSLVEAYYTQYLHNFPIGSSLSDKGSHVSRLLDVCELQSGNDGEQYASYLKDLFTVVEGEIQGRTEEIPVLESGVEAILTHIRACMYDQFSTWLLLIALVDIASRISCATALGVSITELDVRIGPTLMVVISALVCEYCGKMAAPPIGLLQGMANRLVSYGGM